MRSLRLNARTWTYSLIAVAGLVSASPLNSDTPVVYMGYNMAPSTLQRRVYGENELCLVEVQADYWSTCQGILNDYNITLPDFVAMNPQVQPDCRDFTWGAMYCVLPKYTLPISIDGKCNANVTCIGSAAGNCCSAQGLCGSTEQHCGIGNCVDGDCDGTGDYSTDGLCPISRGFQKCGGRWGKCCSLAGKCGSTNAECGIGNCLHGDCAKFSGSVSAAPTSTPTTIPLPSPNSPSQDGTCGYIKKYRCTGETKFNYGNCCSAAGYCGSTAHHCSNLLGCQKDFGLCDEVKIVTVTTTTTSSVIPTTSVVTTTTALPSVVPVGWNRLGCFVGQFQGGTGSRILTKRLYNDPVGLTNDQCTKVCAAAGYNLAGVEAGVECWCDYRLYSAPVRAPAESQCNIPCPGNKGESCGGMEHVNIWYLEPTAYNGWLSMPEPGSCYTDHMLARALSYRTTTEFDTVMTQNKCQDLCKVRRYNYAGIEFGQECFCGDEIINNQGPAPDGIAGCNMRCKGNTNQLCGGTNRLTLFYSKWRKVGCLVDWRENRLFHPYVAPSGNTYLFLKDPAMTIEKCQRHCERMGYTYAGLQIGDQCFCGHSLKFFDPADESACSNNCLGDPTQKCGGSGRISVYTRADTAISD